jgi:sugar lactone lactonase YvrE
MKKIGVLVLLAALAALAGSCNFLMGAGNSGEQGNLVLGGGNSRAVVDPTVLYYDFFLTGPGGETRGVALERGGGSVTLTVNQGIWHIIADAYEDVSPTVIYMKGRGRLNIDVRPGINRALIPMGETTVSTLAGDGTAGDADALGTAARFDRPYGIAVDAAGNVYVADTDNNRIRKISSAGLVSTLAGSGTAGYLDAFGTSAEFDGPYGIAVDAAGYVYVADLDRIRKISPAGYVTTLAGDGTAAYADGPGASAQFNSPCGVAVDAAGNVYVADSANNRIRKISPAGMVSTLAGDGTGAYADGFGTAAQFQDPFGVAVDAAGNVYVADSTNCRIRKISPAGYVTTLAGNGTAAYADGFGTAAQFNHPFGIAVDAVGNVYVADSTNCRIRKISPAGMVSTLAGDGTSGFTDGPGTSARFNLPFGVAVDTAGNVYVGDEGNNRIRKISFE